jgi:hypothetical protein
MLVEQAFSRALREAAPCLSKRFFGCSSRRHASTLSYIRQSSASTGHEGSFIDKSVRRLNKAQSPLTKCPAAHRLNRSPCQSVSLQFFNSPTRAFSQTSRARNISSTEAAAQDNTKDDDGSNSSDGSRNRKSFFPDTSSNTVAYWLLGSAASVFGIVVFGGLTRLTESGCVSSCAQDAR